MTCRWKDKEENNKYKEGNNKYNTFVPEVDRLSTAEDVESQDRQPGEKRKRQPRRPTDKGALFYEYSRD